MVPQWPSGSNGLDHRIRPPDEPHRRWTANSAGLPDGRTARRSDDGPYHRRMLLAVDIGNTNVTIGLFRNGALAATRRSTTHARATADELEHLLDGLLRLDDATFADVSAIAACSVVPALASGLE